MQIDKKALQALLAMNDAQLSALMEKIAKDSGIPGEALGIQLNDIQKIRAALGSATEEDLKKMNDLYTAYRQNRKH